MAQCAIAFGSNLGDSLTIIENAINELKEISELTFVSCSSLYKTKPIGPPQPDYINGCAIFNVKLKPEVLLTKLLEIEQKFGRTREIYWGPRTLDLDIILYDNLILETPSLQIPHPRMRERAFVLVPLAEIAPNWLDPVTKLNITQLLEKIDITGVNRLNMSRN
jgi:2-amino-4-hydroxy-6-hydroxymethyldihydropteridine diphosphokinase